MHRYLLFGRSYFSSPVDGVCAGAPPDAPPSGTHVSPRARRGGPQVRPCNGRMPLPQVFESFTAGLHKISRLRQRAEAAEQDMRLEREEEARKLMMDREEDFRMTIAMRETEERRRRRQEIEVKQDTLKLDDSRKERVDLRASMRQRREMQLMLAELGREQRVLMHEEREAAYCLVSELSEERAHISMDCVRAMGAQFEGLRQRYEAQQQQLRDEQQEHLSRQETVMEQRSLLPSVPPSSHHQVPPKSLPSPSQVPPKSLPSPSQVALRYVSSARLRSCRGTHVPAPAGRRTRPWGAGHARRGGRGVLGGARA